MSGSTGRTVAVERGALVSPEARISGIVEEELCRPCVSC